MEIVSNLGRIVSNSQALVSVVLRLQKVSCREKKLISLVYFNFGLPLWSSCHSSWLQIQRCRVRSPDLPDFLRSSESGRGSTQPRQYN
jgi:hypothetical protein